MSSKSVGTPLSSIFQQWTLQQLQIQSQSQSQPNDHHHPQQHWQDQDHSYNILYQTSSFTSSIIKRVRAAEPVESEHVYRHANVKTPAEVAIQQSRAGPAWLLRLIELAITWSRKTGSTDSASGGSGNTRPPPSSTDQQAVAVLWIQTQNVHVSPIDCLVDEDMKRRIRIIDLCCHKNSFGWDNDDDSDSDSDCDGDDGQKEEHTDYSMTDLSKLFRQLRDELSSLNKPVIIIWQSLMPLFLLHGFSKVLYFLSRLTATSSPEKEIPTCLQVWLVDKEGLTSHQHSQLESLTHAVMFLKGGNEMTIMRRGVRERDNLLRDVIPYELVQQSLSASSTVLSGRMFFRVEELYQKGNKISNDKSSSKSISSTAADMESITLDDNCTKMKISDDKNTSTGAGAAAAAAVGTSSSTRRSAGKVKLRLEDDDEEKTKKNRAPARGHTTQLEQKQQQSRPRIYLEDDDPEFADLDEDDPDDDLDF